jgi:menaquinone-dependent protoporphyrinogen IX oxidase
MAATAASAASAASAAADADASLQLQSALAELSTLLLAGAPTVLTAFDAAAQEHLARNDELLAQVDSARLVIQHTTDVAFANLQAQTQVQVHVQAQVQLLPASSEAVLQQAGAAQQARVRARQHQ